MFKGGANRAPQIRSRRSVSGPQSPWRTDTRTRCSSVSPTIAERENALACGVDTEKVQAECRDGVLKIYLLRPEGEKPKRIRIRKTAYD